MKLFSRVVLCLLACCTSTSTARVPPPSRASPSLDAAAVAAPPDEVAREHPTQDLCAASIESTASSGRAALTFPPNADCADSFCDTVDIAPPGADRCYVANDNIRRAEAQVLASRNVAAPVGEPWDRSTPPRWFDRVDGHLHFDARERERIRANGFVALGRVRYDSYALAYHEVFRQQLPVFISADSILHAIFASHGSMLLHIEREELAPALLRVLTLLRAELARSRRMVTDDARHDLDVYLTVALKLFLPGGDAAPLFDEDAETVAAVLDTLASEQLSTLELFGRPRVIDASQYTPRGHYSDGAPIELLRDRTTEIGSYFRALMWLEQLEFNLVSRDCRSSQPGEVPDPSETPREALDALSLAELVARAGVADDLARFERVYSVFAGRREDVSPAALLALARRANIRSTAPDAFDALRAAVGDGFVRTARTHFMPQGTARLPVIATLIGPRIVPDIAALEGLVHDAVPARANLGFADVAYALGHDRARHYLQGDLQRFSSLGARLDAARTTVRASTAGGNDLYRRWLGAVLAVAAPLTGTLPSFMRSDAWSDHRMNTALVGFGQIRHNYVLMAGQGYDAYGCEIPDGYVEPAVEVYEALIAFARAAQAVGRAQAGHFARVERVLQMLRAIARNEREGRPISEAQRRWIGMVAEYVPAGGHSMDSGQPPRWTGWYFDLFPDREIGAKKAADFVADYFTLTNAGSVRYLGAETPSLAAFVVDVGGVSRVMVGPVARGYELSSPLNHRLNDEEAREAQGHSAPWRASYMPEDERPSLRFRALQCGEGAMRYTVDTSVARGNLEVTALDHHGDPLTETSARALTGATALFTFADTTPNAVEEFHVRVTDAAGHRYDWVISSHGGNDGGE